MGCHMRGHPRRAMVPDRRAQWARGGVATDGGMQGYTRGGNAISANASRARGMRRMDRLWRFWRLFVHKRGVAAGSGEAYLGT
jgi:hypothetical protein